MRDVIVFGGRRAVRHPRLRGPARRGRPVRAGRPGDGRGDDVHVRHHRPAEGRACRRRLPAACTDRDAARWRCRATAACSRPTRRTVLINAPLYHGGPYLIGHDPVRRGEHRGAPAALRRGRDAPGSSTSTGSPPPTACRCTSCRMLRLPEEVRAAFDGSSLQVVYHTAAPCPPAVKRQMIDWWGPVIYETYAATDAGIGTIITSEEWLQQARQRGQGRARGRDPDRGRGRAARSARTRSAPSTSRASSARRSATSATPRRRPPPTSTRPPSPSATSATSTTTATCSSPTARST